MKLDDFKKEPEPQEPEKARDGVLWDAAVLCQTCNEDVEEQTLYPAEKLLVWKCSEGHVSMIEGYTGF